MPWENLTQEIACEFYEAAHCGQTIPALMGPALITNDTWAKAWVDGRLSLGKLLKSKHDKRLEYLRENNRKYYHMNQGAKEKTAIRSKRWREKNKERERASAKVRRYISSGKDLSRLRQERVIIGPRMLDPRYCAHKPSKPPCVVKQVKEKPVRKKLGRPVVLSSEKRKENHDLAQKAWYEKNKLKRKEYLKTWYIKKKAEKNGIQ